MTNGTYADLDKFFNTTRKDIEKKIKLMITDEKILSVLQDGKRLRSILARLIFKTCTKGKESKTKDQRSLEGSVSIELAHGASLVYDDIIDKDDERRGKPALHFKEGLGNAILIGQRMLAIGLDIALTHGEKMAKLYVDSWNEAVSGEIHEINFNKNKSKHKKTSTKKMIFNAYYKIIDMKTASLFSGSCKEGAMDANMSGKILDIFSEYGREIGRAYQLADDLVDLVHGELIDSVIMPLLHKIDNKNLKTSLKEKEIKRYFAKNGDAIRELFVKEIQKHVRRAEELGKSNMIPSSPYKQLLIQAPSYIINKMLREINVTI